MSDAERLDPSEFARMGQCLAGEIAVNVLPRLKGAVLDHEALVLYELRGHMRLDGKPAIRLKVGATLGMACQRCLLPVTVAIESSRNLVFARPAAFAAFDDEGEDEDYLPDDEPVTIRDLVEEECLLSLPLAPMHASGSCPTGEAA